MPSELKSKGLIAANVFDPTRPMRSVLGVTIGTFIVGSMLANVPLIFAGLAGLFLWDLRPRGWPRATTLACQPGRVRIKKGRTLRARDVTGATTARHDGRVSLMLSVKRRRSALTLDLPDDEALAAVAKSLGIGHHGYGEIAVTEGGVSERLGWLLSLLTVPLLVAGAMASEYAVSILAVFCGAMLGFVRLAEAGPRMALTAAGLFVPKTYDGVPMWATGTLLPFHLIEHVERNGRELRVQARVNGVSRVLVVPVTQTRWMRWGTSPAELDHFVSQVRAASDRARGNYVMKNEPGLAADALRRAPNEPLRAWLARIDTLGVGSAGYRNTDLDETELWALLEDPEASEDVRIAAARVLGRKVPERAHVRVAEVVATVRDEDVRKRIAASLDDDALEDHERKAVAR